MREAPRQPKRLDQEDEESLAMLGYLIEINQDTAGRAEDFMNQISDEIRRSKERLVELAERGTAGAKKEAQTVEKILALLEKNYTDAQSRRAEAEQEAAYYAETRSHFIENLKKNRS